MSCIKNVIPGPRPIIPRPVIVRHVINIRDIRPLRESHYYDVVDNLLNVAMGKSDRVIVLSL